MTGRRAPWWEPLAVASAWVQDRAADLLVEALALRDRSRVHVDWQCWQAGVCRLPDGSWVLSVPVVAVEVAPADPEVDPAALMDPAALTAVRKMADLFRGLHPDAVLVDEPMREEDRP